MNYKKRYSLFFFVFIVLSHSCNPDDMIVEPSTEIESPCPADDCSIVWQEPLREQLRSCSSMQPILYENYVLFSDYTCNSAETFRLFDAEDGTLVWEWENHIQSEQIFYGWLHERNGIAFSSNQLLLTTGNPIYSIDADKGTSVWRHWFDYAKGRLSVIDEKVYTVIQNGEHFYNQNKLLRADVDKSGWEIILEMNITDGYSPDMEPPVLYIHPSTDSILIFQNRRYNFDSGHLQLDLMAYNLSQRKFQWTKENLAPIKAGDDVFPLLIKNDKVFFQGEDEIICINAIDATILWNFGLNSQVAGCPLLFNENDVIAKDSEERLFSLNPNTGILNWSVTDMGSNVVNMDIFENTIYYTSGTDGLLRAVDVNTGQILWTKESPNKKDFEDAAFIGGLVINKELGYLYTHDKYYSMCLKLEE